MARFLKKIIPPGSFRWREEPGIISKKIAPTQLALRRGVTGQTP